jgi:hypothetical protein
MYSYEIEFSIATQNLYLRDEVIRTAFKESKENTAFKESEESTAFKECAAQGETTRKT